MGWATEDILLQKKNEVEEESSTRTPITSIAPLTPDQIQQLEHLIGAEALANLQNDIEQFNAQKQNPESEEDNNHTSAGPQFTLRSLAEEPNMDNIHMLAAKGNLKAVQSMLDNGVSIEARDSNGFTPLHAALQGGKLEIVRFLLEHGADANAVGNREIGEPTSLFMAITYNTDPEFVRLLIQYGADVNQAVFAEEITPIYSATQENRVEMLQCLLEAGANVNAQKSRGITSLMSACVAGNINAVELLLKWNADMEIVADDGLNALMLACATGKIDCVKLLLHAGANRNVSVHNDQLNTPLALAKENLPEEEFEKIKKLFDAAGTPSIWRSIKRWFRFF